MKPGGGEAAVASSGSSSVASSVASSGEPPPGTLTRELRIMAVAGLPEVVAGDDLGELIAAALAPAGPTVRDGDIVVVTSKIVSKALGLRIPVQHRTIAALSEAVRVVAERSGPGGMTRIVETLAGPVMAAAGVDASNTGEHPARADATALLLPRDPDGEAARLLEGLRAALARRLGRPPTLGLLISDTGGRPWRTGQTDFALGAAGLRVLVDHRGDADDDGRPLQVTARAVADELAAAADLVKGKTERVPVVVIRGAADLLRPRRDAHAAGTGPGGCPGARSLVRTGPGDWFALGHAEAVRCALGVEPGTAVALEAGVAPVDPVTDTREARIERARAVALHPDGLGTVAADHPRAHLLRDRLDLGGVRVELIQYGLRVDAPEPFTLGVAVGRLLAALAGEGVPARLAQHDDAPEPSGRARASALLIFA